MATPVTASMLYDLVACPHRVTMDLYGDPAKRDKANAFVEVEDQGARSTFARIGDFEKIPS